VLTVISCNDPICNISERRVCHGINPHNDPDSSKLRMKSGSGTYGLVSVVVVEREGNTLIFDSTN